ncbi:hypothetical protein HUG20_13105 [Salicibibacter cibi]|uniref:Uncharacterized protein n=1 Tax=Salicibibacter cibi TaxID=2743001 RepID=A0A7T6ZC11_9BACI|nr:hypothetical protein [Salicibibacter cibi]QQK80738.1 hypothetical protein HUG20_13105 [Salicibibacter cibi]
MAPSYFERKQVDVINIIYSSGEISPFKIYKRSYDVKILNVSEDRNTVTFSISKQDIERSGAKGIEHSLGVINALIISNNPRISIENAIHRIDGRFFIDYPAAIARYRD